MANEDSQFDHILLAMAQQHPGGVKEVCVSELQVLNREEIL